MISELNVETRCLSLHYGGGRVYLPVLEDFLQKGHCVKRFARQKAKVFQSVAFHMAAGDKTVGCGPICSAMASRHASSLPTFSSSFRYSSGVMAIPPRCLPERHDLSAEWLLL